jgi:uncharacterized membrane protein
VSGHSSAQDQDGALSLRIALLMRVGTVLAAVLLGVGVIFGAVGAQPASTALLVTGCATLVLLPVARLLLMADHFARTDRLFLWISVLVLALVVTGATVGLLAHG